MPTATDAELLEVLSSADLTVLGALRDSSNGALLCRLGEGDVLAIYKPVVHERPLWDYPDGTLAGRELAAYLLSSVGGFDVVPPTVLREGPYGLGSLQQWIGPPANEHVREVVAVTPEDRVPEGWLTVLRGEDETGAVVLVSHSDHPALRTTAIFDAVINNSDRKGGHLVLANERIRGFDHGVSLSQEPKLRTVLWGWADAPIVDADQARLRQLAEGLKGQPLREALRPLLTAAEIAALGERISELVSRGRHPRPTPGWPAIPWPAL